MGRNTATINYAIGSIVGNTFPMYLFGSGLLTGLRFALGLVQTQSIEGAIEVALNYYISKLTPFPLNEFLTADGFTEVAVNIAVAVGVGVLVASYRYHRSQW